MVAYFGTLVLFKCADGLSKVVFDEVEEGGIVIFGDTRILN